MTGNQMKATYKNSQLPPSIGDKVIWSKSISRTENFYRDTLDYLYEILDVSFDKYAKSIAVKVRTEEHKVEVWVSATNFELITPSNSSTALSEKLTFMCIVDGKIIKSYETLDDAKEFAAGLVSANWKLQVVIAEVVTVAKVKRPQIDFV